MKFFVLTKYGNDVIIADDFEDAIYKVYAFYNEDSIVAVIKLPEE